MKTSSPPIPFLFKPPHSLFTIPAGNYRAVLRTVSTHEDEFEEGKHLLRLVFDVVAGDDGPVNYSACLEYPQDEEGHAKLNRDLAAFLNPGEIDQMLGMPQELDLLSFVGDEVDMTVATFTSTDGPQYSEIVAILPAGRLITGEMMAKGDDCLDAQARRRWKAPVEGSTITVLPRIASGRNRRRSQDGLLFHRSGRIMQNIAPH